MRLVQSHLASAPTLDQTVEPWLGEFPGLGRITVAADGAVQVEPDPAGDEDPDLREQSLRYGWAEGLSWVRRGFQLAGGAAACPPTDIAPACVLLTGDPHDVVIVIAALVDRSWTVMGDRFTPVQWNGARLIGQPREAPMLMARRRATKLGIEGTPVRDDTDSLRVDYPRQTGPAPVLAVVNVGMRRPHEAPVEPLTGQRRFESAASLMVGGVLAPTRDFDVDDAEALAQLRAETLAEHLRLAALPFCRLRIDSDTMAEDIEALLAWLHEVGAVPRNEPRSPSTESSAVGA